MTARKLASSPIITVATPTYFERFGVPTNPAALIHHACVAFTTREEVRPWVFKGQDGVATIHHPDGRYRSNDGEQIRAAALAHLGIVHVPAWIVAPELKSGALRCVLQDYEAESLPISAVYPSRRGLTVKVRLMIDFIDAIIRRDLCAPEGAGLLDAT